MKNLNPFIEETQHGIFTVYYHAGRKSFLGLRDAIVFLNGLTPKKESVSEIAKRELEKEFKVEKVWKQVPISSLHAGQVFMVGESSYRYLRKESEKVESKYYFNPLQYITRKGLECVTPTRSKMVHYVIDIKSGYECVIEENREYSEKLADSKAITLVLVND